MREYSSISYSFGIILRKARQHAGFSQEKLAALANIDRSYVSLLEQGKRQPSITVLFQLSDALHLSPIEFISSLERDVPKK
jgi:transcriptional regulator with XRE-family HTH domain